MRSNEETLALSTETEEVTFQRYFLGHADAGERAFERRLITIGSDPDCDFVLGDATVSRHHARLEFDGRGYVLTDLGSKNGTWVGDVRIHEAEILGHNKLKFGSCPVSFRLDAEQVQVSLLKGHRFGDLVGKSKQMREVYGTILKIAPTSATVLVEGESGTGKELVARAIHSHSKRREGPLVLFDCATIPERLVESELFGHVRGAFTDAVADREGLFAQADGGTLFLDEIGELPLALQPKLLRALETGEFKRVGASRRVRADVRIVAASNRRLGQEVKEGRFRADLFYRLDVMHVSLPPLRQRVEDIPLLVEHFLKEGGAEGVKVGFSTIQRLQGHHWPGNVRELKNYVARAVVLAEDGRIETRHLSLEPGEGQGIEADFELPYKEAKRRLLEAFETQYWSEILEACGFNVSEAARRGGIHRKSLEYLVKKLDLGPKEKKEGKN